MKLSRVVSLTSAIALAGMMLSAMPRAGAGTFNDLTAFLNATSATQWVNFDTDPNGDPTPGFGDIGNTYSSLGVSFSPGNYFGVPVGAVSLPYGWFNDTSSGNDIVFDADFISGGVTAVGVQNVLYSGIPTGAVLRAYDAANVLLESVTSDNDGSTLDFFGVTTGSDIARITITVPNASGWGMDDLRFGRTAPGQPDPTVPEPGTLAMLAGACVVGSGLLIRRKRA